MDQELCYSLDESYNIQLMISFSFIMIAGIWEFPFVNISEKNRFYLLKEVVARIEKCDKKFWRASIPLNTR